LKKSNEEMKKSYEEMKKCNEETKNNVDKKIEKATKKIFQDLGNFEQELNKLKETNVESGTKLEKVIEDKLVEKVNTPSFADIVSQQVNSKFEKVSVDINKVQQVLDVTKKMAEEEKDRESRLNNVIIYRAPECTSAEDRVKHDKAFCLGLFKDTLEVDMKEEDMKTVFRLGKREDNTCRPILVQFRDRSTKNHVMESLFKLRNASDKYKNISVSHDMTKNEREECKKLIEEGKLKQSQEQGEYIWRVRGVPGLMKLIRIKKH
jgi:hypothetical protein